MVRIACCNAVGGRDHHGTLPRFFRVNLRDSQNLNVSMAPAGSCSRNMTDLNPAACD